MRKKLNNAIRIAFGEPFYQGFIYRVQDTVSMQYPWTWMCPVELSSKEGRNEGTLTYDVTLYLFDRREQYTACIREDIWEEMEGKALSAYLSLFDNEDIDYLQNFKCLPDEHNLTPTLELSIRVTFQVVMPYCHE